MKRSLMLLLLGSTMLAGCDDPPEQVGEFFSNVQECAAVHGQQTCESAFAEARRAHEQNAPTMSRAQCVADFGAEACPAAPVERQVQAQAQQNNGPSFADMAMPAMAGFMLGRATSGSNTQYVPVPVYYGNSTVADPSQRPMYSSRDQSTRPLGYVYRDTNSRAPATIVAPRSVTEQNARDLGVTATQAPKAAGSLVERANRSATETGRPPITQQTIRGGFGSEANRARDVAAGAPPLTTPSRTTTPGTAPSTPRISSVPSVSSRATAPASVAPNAPTSPSVAPRTSVPSVGSAPSMPSVRSTPPVSSAPSMPNVRSTPSAPSMPSVRSTPSYSAPSSSSTRR